MTEGRLVPLPDGLGLEHVTILILATEAIAWATSSGVERGAAIIILGQGIVGLLLLQILRSYRPSQIVTIDPRPLRRELSQPAGC